MYVCVYVCETLFPRLALRRSRNMLDSRRGWKHKATTTSSRSMPSLWDPLEPGTATTVLPSGPWALAITTRNYFPSCAPQMPSMGCWPSGYHQGGDMGKEETLSMLSKLSLLSPVSHLSIYYCAYMYCCQPPT